MPVNALPSEEMRVAAAAGVEGIPLRPDLRTHARWWSSLWSLVTAPGVRQNLIILTVFWVYVACSNILYANSMQASIAADIPGAKHIFASYCARSVQHALLYPMLLCCVWASLRIGWQSLWRKLPLQVLIALAFAALAQPAMGLAEALVGPAEMRQHVMSKGTWGIWDGGDLPVWLATTTTFMLAYGFALTLVMGFAFYQRLRDAQLRSAALERALTASNLAALRMQLSPHTLFNLLHTIRGHISWDPAAAQSMVVQLGDLLRRLLTAGERDFSRLDDELQFVRLYLGLQQRRFADRLSVSVAQSEGLVAAWVPSLILQPLVENAVVHGLAGHEGAVTIRVDAVVNDDMLSLRVVNSIAPGKPQGCAGIGLRNVRERLAIQFGERASFSATPGYDNVWIAEVRLPLLRDGPAA
jgi:two-component system, LytTR family, sensor kinase